jgi:two-component system phosphate regulon sensor histidine kinase PhoR
VVDHGPGVEPEHVPRMTERFYRIEVETSRKKKGTGLGLAIVKHIVQRHRGQISIKSRPGEGLRVDVVLP